MLHLQADLSNGLLKPTGVGAFGFKTLVKPTNCFAQLFGSIAHLTNHPQQLQAIGENGPYLSYK